MNVPTHAPPSMTIEQCLAWTAARARSAGHRERWELVGGVPRRMQDPERYIHVRNKSRIERALEAAIAKAGVAFEVTADGLGVKVDTTEYFIPEVVVFPSGRIGPDDRFAPDPVIVVEVLSPSTAKLDLTTKVAGYGKVTSIAHYLVVDPDARELMHFLRKGNVLVAPHGPSHGLLCLDPPGIELQVSELFSSL